MGRVKQETIPDIPAKEEHEVLIVFTQTYAKNFSAHSYQEATEMAEKEYEMGIVRYDHFGWKRLDGTWELA